mmetsp:Transcript_25647/g.72011  ORF Transcript_25647/g.72011 Transcript_25647/m.72011 type:complete len:387 (+) Transcript_25647:538-1698(+)
MSASAAATCRKDKARGNAREAPPQPAVDSGSAFSSNARATICFVTCGSASRFMARSSKGEKGRSRSGSPWSREAPSHGSLISSSNSRALGFAPSQSTSCNKPTSGVRFCQIAARNSAKSSAEAASERNLFKRFGDNRRCKTSCRCCRAGMSRQRRIAMMIHNGHQCAPYLASSSPRSHTSTASNSAHASSCIFHAHRAMGSSSTSAHRRRPSCNLADVWTDSKPRFATNASSSSSKRSRALPRVTVWRARQAARGKGASPHDVSNVFAASTLQLRMAATNVRPFRRTMTLARAQSLCPSSGAPPEEQTAPPTPGPRPHAGRTPNKCLMRVGPKASPAPSPPPSAEAAEACDGPGLRLHNAARSAQESDSLVSPGHQYWLPLPAWLS